MASEINYSNIDATFPLAGKDNDSQGFRDNFGYIKSNFEYAKSEIEDLQTNAARLDGTNDFNNQDVTKANLKNCTEELYTGNNVSTNTTIDYANGSYQTFTLTGNDITLTLSNFPLANVAKITIMLLSDTSTGMPDGILRPMKFAVNYSSTALKKSASAAALTATVPCTAVTAANVITCGSTAALQVNQPIQFLGTPYANLESGRNYWVKAILGGTTFTISASNTNGVADTVFDIDADDGGDTMVISPSIIIGSNDNPAVFEFTTTDGGQTVLMDYRGTFI